MSVLLFPPPALRRPALVTAWAAVAVCETVRKLANLQATIKWPNDVLIRGKKVCGILIEQRTTGHADFPLATVVGIGLNVTQSAEMFAAAELPDAISLTGASGLSLTSEAAAKELLRQLDDAYHRLLDGDFATLESLWKQRLGLLGANVLVEGVNERQRGRLLDVTLAGLDLEMATGEKRRLLAEAVRHLHRTRNEKSLSQILGDSACACVYLKEWIIPPTIDRHRARSHFALRGFHEENPPLRRLWCADRVVREGR